MAAECRKFYYDWNDEKYKLNQENSFFPKKMEPKPVIDHKDERLPVWNNDVEQELFIRNQHVTKVDKDLKLDFVDSGLAKAHQSSLKPSQPLEEIPKGHKVIVSVLNTRLLRIKAALTLWNKDMNSFIEYVLRLEDDAVLVDLLPILTRKVKYDGLECSSLSMGACLDLLPVLGKLVESKFEDYIVASMDMIREIMKRWWKELQAVGKKENEEVKEDLRCSRSVSGVYMLIITMSDRIKHLSKRSGKVGQKAKVLLELMALI